MRQSTDEEDEEQRYEHDSQVQPHFAAADSQSNSRTGESLSGAQSDDRHHDSALMMPTDAQYQHSSSHDLCQEQVVRPAQLYQIEQLSQEQLHLMQDKAHGNNTDLESIAHSKRHGNGLSAPSDQSIEAVPVGLTPQETSELYKAHTAAWQQQKESYQGQTQGSFEGYQTDFTNEASQPTTTNPDLHKGAGNIDTQTSWQEAGSLEQHKVVSAKRAHLEYTEVFVWGEDVHGQLGIDSQLQVGAAPASRPDFIPVPRSCSFNIVIKQVSCGAHHSAILTSQGHLYMMGSNARGQLGVPQVGPPPDVLEQARHLDRAQIELMFTAGSPILVEGLKSFHVESVSCGSDFSAAICRPTSSHESPESAKAEVFAWGNNEQGQLGQSGLTQVNEPHRVEAFDALQEEVIQVSCGGAHALYLTSERDVVACGSNAFGQCGFDPEECAQTNTPFKVAAFDGVYVAQTSAGFEHSLFLSENGQVFACGSNAESQLGVGGACFEQTNTPLLVEALDQTRVVKVQASFTSSCQSEDGSLYVWGRGVSGENNLPQKVLTISNKVIDVSLGRDLGVAVDDQGMAWSWGLNKHGELGVGDGEPRVHPFPVLNLKGKLARRVHCGHSFTICLGNNIRKEIPLPADLQVRDEQPVSAPAEQRKKKAHAKKKKVADNKRRSTSRPHTSVHTNKVANEMTASSHAQRRPRQVTEAKSATFGPSNSRGSSIERSTSVGLSGVRRPTRNTSTRKASHDRTMASLSMRYGGVGGPSQASSHATSTLTSKTMPHPQAMQIVSSAQHEKSRLHTEYSVSQSNAAERVRSPTAASALNPGARPPLSEYESGKQSSSEFEILKTIKSLKTQVKGFKDENRALKAEVLSKASCIERLEKTVVRLQNDDTHQKQVRELTSEKQRVEMKLRKMKERRNHYRAEKDALKARVTEMQKDGEALFQQVSMMQDLSHSTREDNVSLKAQVTRANKERDLAQKEADALRQKEEQAEEKAEQVERELKSHMGWQESKISDLSSQVKFEGEQRAKMANEIARLERLVQSREDYVVSLENEAIFLRKEIKDAKFNNEKSGYNGFVSGLTQLRASRDRSKSKNRLTDPVPAAEQLTLSKKPVSQEQDYGDDLPQRDQRDHSAPFSKANNAVQEPQFLQSSIDARRRLRASELNRGLPSPQITGISRKSHMVSQEGASPRLESSPGRYRLTAAVSRGQSPGYGVRSSNSKVEAILGKEFSAKRASAERRKDLQMPSIMASIMPRDKQRTSEEQPLKNSDLQTHTQAQKTQQVLEVVPLESIKAEENHTPVSTIERTLTIDDNAILARPSEDLGVSRVEALADNSTVIVKQCSELTAKPIVSEQIAHELESQQVATSSFKEQQASAQETGDESAHKRKVSTMIPLGAPKPDDNLRDQYKQMLMAKMDMKVIQKRKRLERSEDV